MDLEKIQQFNQAQQDAKEKQDLLDAIAEVGSSVSDKIEQTDKTTKKVTVTNDLAKPSDIEKVVSAVNRLSGELKPKDIKPLSDALDQVSQAIAKLPTEYPDFPEFPKLPEQREDVKVTNLSELKEYFKDVVTAIGTLKTSIKFDPKIEVKPADVTVNEKEVDLTPITKGLANLEKAFKAIKTPNFDTKDIIKGLENVSKTVNALSFPVSNYVLPFKNTDGAATQVQLDADGKLPISGTVTTTAPVGGATLEAQQDILNTLAFMIDRLDYGMITDNAKRLKVVPEQATAANLNATIAIAAAQTLATVTTVASVTNTVRQGDLQMQRVNEALLDMAFINGITNNLSIT